LAKFRSQKLEEHSGSIILRFIEGNLCSHGNKAALGVLAKSIKQISRHLRNL